MVHVVQSANHQRNLLKRRVGSLVRVKMQIDGEIGLNYWAWLLWYILFFTVYQAGERERFANKSNCFPNLWEEKVVQMRPENYTHPQNHRESHFQFSPKYQSRPN